MKSIRMSFEEFREWLWDYNWNGITKKSFLDEWKWLEIQEDGTIYRAKPSKVEASPLFENVSVSDLDFDSIINDVMTFSEASKIWGLNDSTLRKLATTNKLQAGIDYRKSGSAWLITRKAMEKAYGTPK